jgi:hypothetical protein
MTSKATGRTCPGCGEPILIGQSVVRLDAGLLLEHAVFDPLIMRPSVYLHAGAGYDTRFDVEDRWCLTADGIQAAAEVLRIHAVTGASGH